MLPLLVAVSAYFIGSIPFGVLFARYGARVDPRQAGSGNIGATNVARTAGRKWGIATFVLDFAKGAVPTVVAALAFPSPWPVLTGFAAIVGHVASVFLGFRGGKGVATAAGVFAVLGPACLGWSLVAFALATAVTRTVGAGSLAAAVGLVLAAELRQEDAGLRGLAWVAATIIVVRHSGNIRRMLGRSEEHRAADDENAS